MVYYDSVVKARKNSYKKSIIYSLSREDARLVRVQCSVIARVPYILAKWEMFLFQFFSKTELWRKTERALCTLIFYPNPSACKEKISQAADH
jgi:hypothetical protein